MVIAQTVLVTPIIAALTRQTIGDLWIEYRDELAAMNVGPLRRVVTLIEDARFSLMTALLAGFGRAAAEVGAIIIVGGNIEGFTRTMTTTIGFPQRADLRTHSFVLLSFRRNRARERLPHHSPVHTMLLRNVLDRFSGCVPLPDLLKQFHLALLSIPGIVSFRLLGWAKLKAQSGPNQSSELTPRDQPSTHA